jgi:hypothetical protein
VLLGHNQHAQCFACRIGRPVDMDLCKAVFRGSPCYLDTTNTLNVSRAGSGAPLTWIFAKPWSGARRATWVTNNTLRVPDRAPPLAWIFVKPCSGARRVTWVTNNTLRVPDRAPPLTWIFVKPCSGARRAAWYLNNTLRVPEPRPLRNCLGALHGCIHLRHFENASTTHLIQGFGNEKTTTTHE